MALINATLVAQAIHFYLAFLLIKHLFFKPIFSVIQEENSLQESLIATVQQQQGRVTQKEQALKEGWNSLRVYFARQAPCLQEQTAAKTPRAGIEAPHLGNDLIQKEIAQVAASIISKVEHVG